MCARLLVRRAREDSFHEVEVDWPGVGRCVSVTCQRLGRDHRVDHCRFEPVEITAPAGKKLKLVIDNQDATPEEFESHDLRREKVVAGNSKATVWIGPLKPGTYSFVGEYHEATAKGTLIVK